jgi:DNA primase
LPETAEHFGAGLCARGIMKGRIAISVHNEKGELVAYCGRAVTEKQAQEEGKYKMPDGFHKSLVVYNIYRQEPGIKTLVLVESFLSVWRLYQAGVKNAAALMGSVLSKEQEDLIADLLGPSGQVLLILDADESGRQCAADCLKRLGARLWVKADDIGQYARKPHQLTPEEIRTFF